MCDIRMEKRICILKNDVMKKIVLNALKKKFNYKQELWKINKITKIVRRIKDLKVKMDKEILLVVNEDFNLI